LSRRVVEFDRLASAGSPFDLAREAALKELSRPDQNLHIPDHTGRPYILGRRVAVWNADHTEILETTPLVEYPNYLPKVQERWSDCEQMRWNLPAALADVDRILELELSRISKQVFDQWRQELWDVLVRVDGEHLLGSYLIDSCRRAVAPGTSRPDDYKALLARLSEDPERFTKEIQDAADDLFRSSDQDSQSACSAPPGFPEGPIIGNLTDLASWVCPVFGKKKDRRTLRKLGKSKTICLLQVSGHTHEVWFADLRTCSSVNGARLDHKAAAEKQKAAKRSER
jgi:hypothetical protein